MVKNYRFNNEKPKSTDTTNFLHHIFISGSVQKTHKASTSPRPLWLFNFRRGPLKSVRDVNKDPILAKDMCFGCNRYVSRILGYFPGISDQNGITETYFAGFFWQVLGVNGLVKFSKRHHTF